MSGIETIRQAFAAQFAYWGLELPPELPPPGARGSLYQGGWTVHYQWGEENGQPYLAYYASQRMTNETLNRIHADGRFERLAEVWELFPSDDEAAQRKVMENNRQFYAWVRELGLR